MILLLFNQKVVLHESVAEVFIYIFCCQCYSFSMYFYLCTIYCILHLQFCWSNCSDTAAINLMGYFIEASYKADRIPIY